jgi:glyoxylase-like metal-dependent hydrolase (beta-lactamase superfamily II)
MSDPTPHTAESSSANEPPSVNEIEIRGLLVGVFQENCWVIGNKRTREAICIDPGEQPDDILHMAAEMGVQIKLIANSHAHLDHILGVRGIQAQTDARFLLHQDDLELAHSAVESAARYGLEADPVPDPDHYIADGELVQVDGLTLRTFHTPGHTQGSVCYFTDQLLFSGDTLFQSSIGRTDLPGGNHKQEMASIVDKLLTLPDETIVLPGHMQQTTIGAERQSNPFIQQELRDRGLLASP